MKYLLALSLALFFMASAFSQQIEVFQFPRSRTFKEISVRVEDVKEVFVRLSVKTKKCNAFGGDLELKDISHSPDDIEKRYFMEFGLALHYMGCDDLDTAILIQSNVVAIRSSEIPKFSQDYTEVIGKEYYLRANLLVPAEAELEVFTENPQTK